MNKPPQRSPWGWIESEEDLFEFLSLVVVCAPDEFPVEDFLPADSQLNLERAFEELNWGMALVRQGNRQPELLASAQRLLDEALASYSRGDDVQGAHLVQDFEALVFGSKSPG